MLAETRMPNLASRAMGLALRNLPEAWQEKHGYRSLLADKRSAETVSYYTSSLIPQSAMRFA